MNRPITEDDLHGFVDHALDAKRHAEVHAYLDAHPEVLARITRYADQRDWLRAALAPIAEEPIPSQLNVLRLIRRQRQPFRISHVAAVAAALAFMAVGGIGGWVFRGAESSIPKGIFALGREASESYSVFATDHIRPVEMRAGESAQLINWVSRFLGRTLTIPDLSKSGYDYLGGRVVATSEGPAVLLLYDDGRGSRLAMLARTMADARDTPMAAVSGKGAQGYAWANQGIGYSLVGAKTEESLHPIADEARRQISGT
ncbi:anti-sigma factor [Afipia sp. 1NLS2]|uniref:anti-sigma factor family protein n=1 Tax=Afipia sp. 1NLS2 TaxID=666684 RepID=UPI0001D9E23F|nr:anti-sigma factor [Afipia sp. 1NLS2]EFI50028.1 putative transmembrane anti-sigma factor [Afipia sp. 1NLS2]